ncbi:MAG: PD-(D/E)XK nuclease family protein [Bacteroidaceae bacterium]|nr:PD-(D/E)XK nuclease family protein [Bacteroidaceae bacterium]
MKIIFSPEFNGKVFLGTNRGVKSHMDMLVADTMQLVSMLEMHLGIHMEEHPAHFRTVKYFEALSTYMKENPGNALEASFKLSSLGTAQQALHWRDALILSHWKRDEMASLSGRLEVLAGTEAYFSCPGMADRLHDVILELSKQKKDFLKDMEVEMPCKKDILHPAIIQLLDTMEQHGARLTIMLNPETKEHNLRYVYELLQSKENKKITLAEKDDSFLIYSFPDEQTANEYLALKGDELKADVWINSANKSLDNWLRLMGKPTTGSTMQNFTPQLIQLFVLSIDMMREPLNIKSLINWLYSPLQPLGSYFGNMLADKIISEGGYRNNECHRLVNGFVEGNYLYRDDKDMPPTPELVKQMKRCKQLADAFLPSFETPEKETNSVEVVKLKKYLNSLSAWAKERAFLLRDKPGNEGWCSQLESLAQLCDTFILLVDASGCKETVDFKLIDSWISTLYQGESFMQYNAQKGSLEMVDSPTKLADTCERTVWMNFCGTDASPLSLEFLYTSEKKAVKDHLSYYWKEENEIQYQQFMEKLPFSKTTKQLILVVTDYQGGEVSRKHPILVRLESQVENLKDFILRPNLLEERMEPVNKVLNDTGEDTVKFQNGKDLIWPHHISVTTLDTLVEYPLDYLMQYLLNIVNTGPGSIKDVKATKGDVAHAVIESLFAPRDGKRCSTADEIELRIKTEFDEQVQKQTEACGAILYLPENRLEAALLKEQLHKCVKILLKIIRDNHLTVTGCEKEEGIHTGIGKKELNLKGFIDMTLEDENRHPVVFDFKWTSSKNFHRDLLADNRSTQLELYRWLLSVNERDDATRTAYFLMPEGHLYSKEHFEGNDCTQLVPANKDNIVEQLKNSFVFRKNQLLKGTVEIIDGKLAENSSYYNSTEKKNLYPLNVDANGFKDDNIFSNYGMFKQ